MSEFYANTFYLWNRRRIPAASHLHRSTSGATLFPVVSREKLPHIANSDFHRRDHLYAWKTLLKAEKTVSSVLDALKRASGIGVLRLTPQSVEATA